MQPIKQSMWIDMSFSTSQYLSSTWIPFGRWGGAQVRADAEGRECSKAEGKWDWRRSWDVQIEIGSLWLSVLVYTMNHLGSFFKNTDSQILPQTYWIRIYQQTSSSVKIFSWILMCSYICDPLGNNWIINLEKNDWTQDKRNNKDEENYNLNLIIRKHQTIVLEGNIYS